jgi:hypothetical protein
MTKTLTAAIAATAALVAAPAFAQDPQYAAAGVPEWVYTDSNKHFLDYRTDLSEAKRELESDMRRAHDEGDIIDARAEYDREVADAEHDFRKEMAEKGVIIPKGTVILEGEVAMLPR